MTDAQPILARALRREELSKADITALLCIREPAPLFAAADRVRREFVGDEVYLRALIEFSNYCKNDCLYCGISRSNPKADRYRLTPE
ncbi:MAG: [FeFe] hydrogenase H-cluster radical SAM maturase HydE, partial [Elusimicrobiaceae bacterium]|nr:[FeFe] hydrogenase H-cluster radical SAM maturase HydE [Elusimicrobiaceae bacterium]